MPCRVFLVKARVFSSYAARTNFNLVEYKIKILRRANGVNDGLWKFLRQYLSSMPRAISKFLQIWFTTQNLLLGHDHHGKYLMMIKDEIFISFESGSTSSSMNGSINTHY